MFSDDIPEQPIHSTHVTCERCGCVKRRGSDCRVTSCSSNLTTLEEGAEVNLTPDQRVPGLVRALEADLHDPERWYAVAEELSEVENPDLLEVLRGRMTELRNMLPADLDITNPELERAALRYSMAYTRWNDGLQPRSKRGEEGEIRTWPDGSASLMERGHQMPHHNTRAASRAAALRRRAPRLREQCAEEKKRRTEREAVGV